MKRILVPCDFSAPSRQAYKFAVTIASASGGEIFVLHTISFLNLYESTFANQPYPLDAIESKKIADNATATFDRMKKMHPSPSNVTVSFFPVQDYLLPAVLTFTEERKIDLIVMGTHGASGMEEFFIGSNTEKVVRFSPVPVIAVRNAPYFGSIRNIVFPNSLELNQTELIAQVKKLQELFDATLHILLVNTPTRFQTDQDAIEAMHEFAKHYSLKHYTVNFRNNPNERDAIIDFVNEINGDMLAMATHGRRGLAHLFNGSLTETVVNHVECPIWTYSLHKKDRPIKSVDQDHALQLPTTARKH